LRGRSGQDQLGDPEYVPATPDLWTRPSGEARSAPQQPVNSPAKRSVPTAAAPQP